MKLRMLVPLLVVWIPIGCGSALSAEQPAVERTDFSPAGPVSAADLPGTPAADSSPAPGDGSDLVAHPYFPLEPGTLWVYEGDADGIFRRDEVRVVESEVVAGVRCATLRQEVYLDGVLVEVTDHWFAQDGDGNVWQFGERSTEFDEGIAAVTPDSWRAGENGAMPWIYLPSEPRAGDVYQRAGGPDGYRVVSLGVAATVPFGAFANCLEVEESNLDDPEDQDRIIFGPGVGLLSESSPTGTIELVEFR